MSTDGSVLHELIERSAFLYGRGRALAETLRVVRKHVGFDSAVANRRDWARGRS